MGSKAKIMLASLGVRESSVGSVLGLEIMALFCGCADLDGKLQLRVACRITKGD